MRERKTPALSLSPFCARIDSPPNEVVAIQRERQIVSAAIRITHSRESARAYNGAAEWSLRVKFLPLNGQKAHDHIKLRPMLVICIKSVAALIISLCLQWET